MATITTAELAAELNTTPRETRKFLRATLEVTPGKGSRYAIEKRDVRSLKSKYSKWVDEKAPKAPKVEEIEVEETEDDFFGDEVYYDGDLEDLEPTDEELAEIES